MAPHIGPNLLLSPRLISNPFTRVLVRAYIFILLRSKPAGLARALVAMAQNEIPFNADDFNGFGAERAAILKIAKENSTNPIILGGDLHDSWAWILHEGGNITGTPVAVNLGCPGVTSPGFGAAAYPLLQALERFLGGPDGVFQLLNGLFKQQNPGLVFGDTQYKGFYAVKATQSTHTAEYIHIKRETILSDFATARSASRGIVANFTCAASLQTTAGQRGSLVKQKSCSAIEFDTERPSVWSIPYPVNIGISNLPKLFNCDMDACTLS